tara:strand:- start:38 stop:679 length:642 start_codon:yes stop_codon:yes gene_type:complete
MTLKIIITIFLLLLIMTSLQNNSQDFYESDSELLNIYDQPLQECGNNNMSNGSWDNNKKCSELDGGVHQICVNNIAENLKNFSLETGQSDWSDKREDNNHCVCLGAWSLYNSKLTKDKKNKLKGKRVLKCDAIPKVALSNRYVRKFSQWNGLEIENQIKDGVNSLVEECVNTSEEKSKNLKNNYCQFAKNISALNNTETFRKLCKKKKIDKNI